ncbi:unnamed protein product [Amoebophrya sp. A120]|nr:unnamed protein product [Amoebophrya sp. A120]|eukprot:GSA120T00023451001.1
MAPRDLFAQLPEDDMLLGGADSDAEGFDAEDEEDDFLEFNGAGGGEDLHDGLGFAGLFNNNAKRKKPSSDGVASSTRTGTKKMNTNSFSSSSKRKRDEEQDDDHDLFSEESQQSCLSSSEEEGLGHDDDDVALARTTSGPRRKSTRQLGNWDYISGGVLKEQQDAGDSLAVKIKRRLEMKAAEELEELMPAEENEEDEEPVLDDKTPRAETETSCDHAVEDDGQPGEEHDSGGKTSRAPATKKKSTTGGGAAKEASINCRSSSQETKAKNAPSTTTARRTSATWLSTQDQQQAPTSTLFGDLDLSRPFLKALQEMKFYEATAIQRDCIPAAIKGHDLLATAETGSGKTAAFLLPTLERISRSPHVASRKRVFVSKEKGYKIQTGRVATKALILLPTRELATQCYSMLQGIAKYSLVTSSLIAGGFSQQEQATNLKHQPDILICTPGRILDHLLNTQSVHLEMLEIVVFDEADRLLEMGFRDECKEVLRRCSHGRQTLLFSATWNTDVQDLASVALNKPLRIEASQTNKVARTLQQEFVAVPEESKREATLLHLCKNTYKNKGVIIFFQTKKQCHRMAILFGLMKLNFAELHGNLSQTERCENVSRFQNNEISYLLATDLAARGLDLRNVECVINFEVPNEDAKYIHRCGRTARMGRTGQSVTLHCGQEEYRRVKKLAKLCAKKVNSSSSTGEGVDDKNCDASSSPASVVTKRSIDESALDKLEWQINRFQQDVVEVLEEEKTERELRLASVELSKAENLEKHKDEIAARPKKVWRLTNNEKQKQRENEKEIRMALEKDSKKESRKQKRMRMDKEMMQKQNVAKQKIAKRKTTRAAAANGGSGATSGGASGMIGGNKKKPVAKGKGGKKNSRK